MFLQHADDNAERSYLYLTISRMQQYFYSIIIIIRIIRIIIIRVERGYSMNRMDRIEYNTIQYNTIQYNTIQYNTIE